MMYGFPEILSYGGTQPVFDTTETMFGMGVRQKEIWYTIKDGNWNDPTIWRTVGGRRHDFPGNTTIVSSIDDVYVKNTVLVNASGIVVNNLSISNTGTWKFNSAFNVTINGNLQCYGTWDMNSFANNVTLMGANNFVNSFINPTNSTVTYGRLGDQNVLNLTYHSLAIGAATGLSVGTKTFTSDITLAGNFTNVHAVAGAGVDFSSFDLTVNGTSALSTGFLRKTTAGTITFVGLVSESSNGIVWDMSSDPTVEYRGGINFGGVGNITYNGTPTINFTTNSQTITTGNVMSTNTFGLCTLNIVGAITVTIATAAAVTNQIALGGAINGNNAGSTLVNKATLNFTTSAAATTSMTTGVVDLTSFANVVGYIFNGNATLPYTSYSSLTISGTGTKTLAGDTTLVGNYICSNSSILECSTFNFTVNGTSSLGAVGGTTSKTGAGTILFVGSVVPNSHTWNLTGNPTVEFRGGIAYGSTGTQTFNSATTFTFTTNSQNITSTANVVTTGTINYLISGAITVTMVAGGQLSITGTLDGNNASSTFDNRGTINYGNATRPMVTNGVFQTNAAVNTVNYNRAGAQDLTGGTYRNLTLSVSGVKTQQGNISVINTYSVTGTASRANNGFTFGNP